jgi:hypothetical protein
MHTAITGVVGRRKLRRRATRWRRYGAVMIAVLLSLSTAGCSTTWQRYQASPANPANWVRALLPPDGQSFYNEKSHEIERSLNHQSRSDALQ